MRVITNNNCIAYLCTGIGIRMLKHMRVTLVSWVLTETVFGHAKLAGYVGMLTDLWRLSGGVSPPGGCNALWIRMHFGRSWH